VKKDLYLTHMKLEQLRSTNFSADTQYEILVTRWSMQKGDLTRFPHYALTLRTYVRNALKFVQ